MLGIWPSIDLIATLRRRSALLPFSVVENEFVPTASVASCLGHGLFTSICSIKSWVALAG